MKKFIIIDGNALVHRAFHAIPPLTTKDGKVVNAVYGFASILLKVMKDIKPDYLALTFDVKGKTFRDELFPEYKAQRVKQPQELYDQIPIIKELVTAFRIPIYEKIGVEADDVIGTLCHHPDVKKEGVLTIIVTGDMDTLQLIDADTKILTLKKGVTETLLYDEEGVKTRFGLKPEQMIDYKALRGDPSDNISGVPGIGEMTACELLRQFGTLDKIYEYLKSNTLQSGVVKQRVAELLRENKEKAFLSKKLVTILTDVPIDFHLADAVVREYDREKVVHLFSSLEFKSLMNRLPEMSSLETQGSLFKFEELKKKYQYHLIENEKKFASFLVMLKKQKQFAFDTETSSLDYHTANLLGISFSWKEGEAYFVSTLHSPLSPTGKKSSRSSLKLSKDSFAKIERGHGDVFLQALKPIFEDSNIKKAGHNMKFDYEVLNHHGILVQGLSFDTMIASYLLNPTERQHNLDALTFAELKHEKISFEELCGSGSNNATAVKSQSLDISSVPVAHLALYSCEDADYTERLARKMALMLRKSTVDQVFREIEMPLIPILALMETTGIKLNSTFLRKLSLQLKKQLIQIDACIFKQAGKEFNIDSPAQLKGVLFDTLGLTSTGLRKIKTGISTAVGELEKLRKLHPIVDMVMRHRELAKLQSTYTQSLIKLVHPETGRLHTSFQQTIAATGRLSSTDPNLQNIPIRSELGRQIRKAFIAENGFQIVSCDYSQIELRIAAHMAEDVTMIRIFERGEDVHTSTAAQIFHVPLEKVTKTMRSAAKTVNFGVLYGQGPKALAEQTDMSLEEAKKFIEKYFIAFSGVRRFIENTKKLAYAQGYVETLFGRRRYLPNLYSGVSILRASAERMAVNTPIQGTEADVVKIAMKRVYERLLANTPPQTLSEGATVTRPSSFSKTWLSRSSKDRLLEPSLRSVRMLLQVHDELVFEVKDEIILNAATLFKQEMEQAITLRVPVKVDVSVGKNWGELKAILL